MTSTKIDSIVRTGADAVVGVDASCLLQIRGALSRSGSPVKALHLAQILAGR
jgi:L-lactate dehydrogenase complex protein LldE